MFPIRTAPRSRPLAPLAAAAVLVVNVSVLAQTNNGALRGELGNASAILDTRVAALIRSNLPECNKKLLVMTQCYGGNFLDEFVADANIAVASATTEGELSHNNTYDIGAAFGLRPGAGRNGQIMHTEAIEYAQQAAADAHINLTESPAIGGGLPLASYPLELVGPTAQSFMHILFYAGDPTQADMNAYGIIREFYPYADIVVVSSGLMEPFANYDASQYGLDFALEAIGNRMGSCAHFFVMFVCDHGHQIWNAGEEDQIFMDMQFPTDPLPPSVEQDLNGTTDPSPMMVLTITLSGTGTSFSNAPGSPPFFGPSDWTVSVPLSLVYSSMTPRQVPFGDDDGTIGNDPDEGIRLEFDMTVAEFVAAFVGRPNLVTVTTTAPHPWPIALTLDPGPIAKPDLPEPCQPDFNFSGTLSVQDIFDFLAGYFSGDLAADFNFSGGLSVQDIFDFLEAYFTGCD